MVRGGSAWTHGEMGPSWMLGELRDPARQAGKITGSWPQTVEEVRRYKMSEGMGDGLVTTSSHIYAQSMYLMYIVCINLLCFNKHYMSHVLLYLSVSGE
jgi:hypothetical protein